VVKKLNEKEIEAEKSRLTATFDKEWKPKRDELDNQIEKLEEQREKFLIGNNEGYNCKKCGRFVEKGKRPLSYEVRELCWNCDRVIQIEKKKEKFLNKIKSAKLVDVELTGYNSLKSLTFHKDGTMFRFKGATDDDVSYIELDDEWHEEEQKKIDRPGDKHRLEKPLIIE